MTFLTPTLFRTGIPLPGEVPIGTYDVEIKLFSDGALVTKTDTAFEIVKVGFEQFVANTARKNGFVYGLATAFMALMTGWMASIVFRRRTEHFRRGRPRDRLVCNCMALNVRRPFAWRSTALWRALAEQSLTS